MSGGVVCRVAEHRPSWRVLARRCNRSAFNGYRWTPSRYSQVWCPLDHAPDGSDGGAMWRTAAEYVDQLPDA